MPTNKKKSSIPKRGRGRQAKHNEGLGGSEGKGSDDKVIDSRFSLSGRKAGGKSAESSSEYEEEESDVDIMPDSMQGRGSGVEGHGRGTSAPGAGA